MSWPVLPLGLLGSQASTTATDNDTYQIEKSLRFNSADIAHLTRTPLSASNQKKYTFNFWVKRSGLGVSSHVFTARFSQTGQRYAYIAFESDDTLTAFSGVYSTGASTTTSYNYKTTQVFRDTSAWYMITVAVDTTNATASERVKLYVNGTQITSFSTATQPALNQDGYWNSAQLHAIGTFTGTTGMFSGYLAEINFIDGQALTPSSFGETDAVTGRWKAKAYSGTYGTNGFYLNFADNSGATATTLGKDSAPISGAHATANNWTPNNLSVTPGVGNDSLTDSPSNYGTISTTLVNDTYQISKSLRFNSADSANLTRTLPSSGNLTTWTWSGWIKPTKMSAQEGLFYSGNGVTVGNSINFNPSNQLEMLYYNSAYVWRYVTTQAFRDPTSWYHVVGVYDSSNPTQADRVRLYVNGVRITSFSVSTAVSTISQVGSVNNSSFTHYVGSEGAGNFFNGYLAEVNFIDGQALTPDSFGTRDINTYLWKPKAYTGTYGTNGFYLNFSDSSNTTATTLGKDQAGSNNWTPNNFSVSAGPGNDSLVDSPTYYGTDTGVGGEVRGNYATLNPLGLTGVFGTYSNGNLEWASANTDQRAAVSSIPANTGSSDKWYAECTIGSKTSVYWTVGLFGNTNNCYSTGPNIYVRSDGVLAINGAAVTTDASVSFTQGDVISVSYNNSAGEFRVYKNGVLSGLFTRSFSSASKFYFGCGSDGSGGIANYSWNFGQRPFIHAAPSGFRALRDYNKLPTPTGGEVRGNYATLNPISTIKGNIIDGNLTTNGGDRGSISTIGMTSGKWYCEMYVTAVGAESSVGISRGLNVMNPYIGSTSDSWGYYFNGLKYNNGSGTSYGSSYTTGDTIGAAFDADAGTIVFYKNGISQGTAYTSLTSGPYYFATSGRSSTSANNVTMNFGQRPWAYDAPFGFLPLCTTLLPQPIVQKPSSYMDVVTFTATGANQDITGFNFSPDLVWIKNRANWAGNRHTLFDTIRGAVQRLDSSTTEAEAADNDLFQFNSNGFSGNLSGTTYVAWAWDESPIAGMDIVGYTGTGSNMTISHSLGVTPKMIINKLRSGTGGWPVYHASLGNTGAVQLESTGAFNVSSTYWNNTSPTSSNFTVAAGLAVNGATYINYVFAEVEGFSKFGSYTGNGSADGPFVWCGFRPRWVLFKESSASGNNWNIYDTARDVSNPEALQLKASAADAEGSNTFADYTSNGFKVRVSTAGINSSGQTYIFAAFAESPFKYARAR